MLLRCTVRSGPLREQHKLIISRTSALKGPASRQSQSQSIATSAWDSPLLFIITQVGPPIRDIQVTAWSHTSIESQFVVQCLTSLCLRPCVAVVVSFETLTSRPAPHQSVLFSSVPFRSCLLNVTACVSSLKLLPSLLSIEATEFDRHRTNSLHILQSQSSEDLSTRSSNFR